MQQRQLRLGDILDDYCPRERRVTNHAIVAMIGETVKQTRCTTCDAEHEYKHAKIPRQRRKGDTPAVLYAQVAAGAPKRVAHEHATNGDDEAAQHGDESIEKQEGMHAVSEPDDHTMPRAADSMSGEGEPAHEQVERAMSDAPADEAGDPLETGESIVPDEDEGPVHRPLIRASLPRPEGQQPPARPIPEFTIRQPGGRPNRFRPRHQRGAGGMQGHHGQFQGNRSNGNMAGGGPMRGPRPGGGRPGLMKRHGPPGRKRSK
jgi:hypothetical protein